MNGAAARCLDLVQRRVGVGEQGFEIAAVARRIVKIETAIEPRFQAHFVRAMGFPDSDDAAPRRTRASKRGTE